jgi:hypothetical protein
MDYRRSFNYWNINGPASHVNAAPNADKTTFLSKLWDVYYAAIGKAYNSGSRDPMSAYGRAFLDKNPKIITLLTHLRALEAEKVLAQFPERTNLFTDISGFKDGLFIIDQMQEKASLRGRMVFGSGASLMDLHATVFLMDTSEIGQEAIDEIYSGQKLLALLD